MYIATCLPHIPLYTLLALVEDHYLASWFDDEDFYNEYLAERDLALITHFVQLLWDKLRNHLPEEVMKVVWTYTRTYNHIEYYFFYPDLYMEWLCTYWINGVKHDQNDRNCFLCFVWNFPLSSMKTRMKHGRPYKKQL